MKRLIKKILKEEFNITKPVVVFVAGLDGAGYEKLSWQTQKLKSGLGDNFTIIDHRYIDLNGALESIKSNPNCYVVLFSAGCKWANSISPVVTDKSKMYIVDPYTCSLGTLNNVTSSGINKNNILGTTNVDNCTGNNVAGTKRSCKGYKNTLDCHWDGLRIVGELIKSVADTGGSNYNDSDNLDNDYYNPKLDSALVRDKTYVKPTLNKY